MLRVRKGEVRSILLSIASLETLEQVDGDVAHSGECVEWRDNVSASSV